MHTFVAHVGDASVIFHHNSDLSGNVLINVVHMNDGTEHVALTEVPGLALLDFIADYVRRQRIAELERSGTSDILNVGS